MSWSKLTPAEVQAVRMSLHLSVKEASEWIANHKTPRTWQKYEQGSAPIPDDIDEELYACSQVAEKLFDKIHDQAFEASEAGKILQLKFYRDREDWVAQHGENFPINWRIHQSVVARVFNEFGSDVELI